MPRPSKNAREPILRELTERRKGTTSDVCEWCGFSRTLTFKTLISLEKEGILTRLSDGRGSRAIWIYVGANVKIELVRVSTGCSLSQADHPVFHWWFFNPLSGKIEPEYD